MRRNRRPSHLLPHRLPVGVGGWSQRNQCPSLWPVGGFGIQATRQVSEEGMLGGLVCLAYKHSTLRVRCKVRKVGRGVKHRQSSQEAHTKGASYKRITLGVYWVAGLATQPQGSQLSALLVE
jgi:hypothetical protein